MSPANRAGIGTCRPANSADPVVVASSGPNPSATLHEGRSAQLPRMDNGIHAPGHSSSFFPAVGAPRRLNGRISYLKPRSKFEAQNQRNNMQPPLPHFCASAYSKGVRFMRHASINWVRPGALSAGAGFNFLLRQKPPDEHTLFAPDDPYAGLLKVPRARRNAAKLTPRLRVVDCREVPRSGSPLGTTTILAGSSLRSKKVFLFGLAAVWVSFPARWVAHAERCPVLRHRTVSGVAKACYPIS